MLTVSFQESEWLTVTLYMSYDSRDKKKCALVSVYPNKRPCILTDQDFGIKIME